MKRNKISKEKIKTWLVTGASSGIGKEMCMQLKERGYNIVAISRRLANIEGNNILNISCDITDYNSVKNAILQAKKHFGRIDVIANNAGTTSYYTFEEETKENMQQVMNVNFWGGYNIIKELLPDFRKNGYGTIINNTSECGIIPRMYGSAYCASKHAMEGLSSALWYETQKFCRVMTVELSFFSGTEIGKDLKKGYSQFEEYKNIPWTMSKKRNPKPNNDVKIAVKHIIDEVECEKCQRRLMLGYDIIEKIETEINSIQTDIKLSKNRAYSCWENKKEISLLQKIFSIKNEHINNKKRKILRILGIKITL